MSRHDSDLDRLSTLLGQCLGRIDEQAFHVQRFGDEADDEATTQLLEHETSNLQELVDAVLAGQVPVEHSDLNRLLEQCLLACVAELDLPILVRQRLERNLPAVACPPPQLVSAVQRALVLAVDQLDVGGELIVTTRHEDDLVTLELESRGNLAGGESTQQARATTLCEFVTGLGGSCQVAVDDQQNLRLGIELPLAVLADEC